MALAATRRAELHEQPDLLVVDHLVKEFPLMKGGIFRRGSIPSRPSPTCPSLRPQGEVFGLVGESGSGKTTTGRLLVGFERMSAGEVRFDGNTVHGLNAQMKRRLSSDVQFMFQDPYSSLDPRMRVGAIVREPLRAHNRGSIDEQRVRVDHLMDEVGLTRSSVDRYPHEFSGGQRQRIGLARALALEPKPHRRR